MKRYLNLVALMFIIGNLISAPKPINFVFRKPVFINSTTWKFMSVAPGVNAYAIVTGSKNATINMVDDSASYAYAWQPNIKYTNTTTNSTDSSYVEFTIKFVNSATDSLDIQDAVAMTLIDVDGNSNFREMVKTSLPATSLGISGSLITTSQDSKWLTSYGSTTDFVGIDTSVYKAMTQINFTNVSSFVIRVGVLGKITAGATRQHSLYFKPFNAMTVALPVELNFFDSKLQNNNVELIWSTSSEANLNHFEIYRSIDGSNYFKIGSIDAKGNSNELNNYSFTNFDIRNIKSSIIYYRLKMIDNQGNFKLSNISQVRISALSLTSAVNIFPNPTTEYINVTLNNVPETDITIHIVNSLGQTVQTYFNPEISSDQTLLFDVRALENGVYIINMVNSDGITASNKFIKR